MGTQAALPAQYFPDDHGILPITLCGTLGSKEYPLLVADRDITIDQIIARWHVAESTANPCYMTLVAVANGTIVTTDNTFKAAGREIILPSQRISVRGAAHTNTTVIPDPSKVFDAANVLRATRSTGGSGYSITPGECLYVAFVTDNTSLFSDVSFVAPTELTQMNVQLRVRSILNA